MWSLCQHMYLNNWHNSELNYWCLKFEIRMEIENENRKMKKKKIHTRLLGWHYSTDPPPLLSLTRMVHSFLVFLFFFWVADTAGPLISSSFFHATNFLTTEFVSKAEHLTSHLYKYVHCPFSHLIKTPHKKVVKPPWDLGSVVTVARERERERAAAATSLARRRSAFSRWPSGFARGADRVQGQQSKEPRRAWPKLLIGGERHRESAPRRRQAVLLRITRWESSSLIRLRIPDV